MVRRQSVYGFLVAVVPIAVLTFFSLYFAALVPFIGDSALLFLVAIIAVILGGAITRSGKAGAVAGFLAVWLPSFSVPLFLLLAIGSADPSIGFAIIAIVILLIGLMIASFVLGAVAALIGGVAGYLTGRRWPLKPPEIVNVTISQTEYDYLKAQTVKNHMLQPKEGDKEGK